MNDDLRRARALLEQGSYTCVLCLDTQVRTCTARGIRPLLELMDEELPWTGFSAADKVVGKATAFLYVLLGVQAVYTPIISETALDILRANNVDIHFDCVVPAIFNRSRTGFCPMETAVREIDDPRDALRAIRETLVKL